MADFEATSPITGEEIRGNLFLGINDLYVWEEHFGKVVMSRFLFESWLFNHPLKSHSQREVLLSKRDSLLLSAYARSIGYRLSAPKAYEESAKRILLVCYKDELDTLLLQLQRAGRVYTVDARAVEEMSVTARTLSIHERAMKTLDSFYEKYLCEETELFCDYVTNYDGQILFGKNIHARFESGITFSTIDSECHFVYEYLVAKGYLRAIGFNGVMLTSKAYEES